ncbi:MAG: site-2 protease family protein [Magnetospiraceae bacterium]
MDIDFYSASAWVLPVLIAVTLHEAAHGWVAHKLGDNTAFLQGRVTFNPIKHVDPFGTIVLPLMLLLGSGGSMMFGYAKPVPVNFRNLRKPRRDMVLVALAGPMTNFLIAAIAARIFFHTFASSDITWLHLNLFYMAVLNVMLGVLNMLPLPPLDGGRVAVGLLPRAMALPLARLERFGFLIVLGLFFVVPLVSRQFGLGLDPFRWLVLVPTRYIMGLFGIGV